PAPSPSRPSRRPAWGTRVRRDRTARAARRWTARPRAAAWPDGRGRRRYHERSWVSSSGDVESPARTVADDAARRRVMEVGAEHGHAAVGVALAEGAARLAGLLDVAVEVAAPLRLGHLHGTVHEVPGDDGLTVARAQSHADVPGRVAGGGLEPELVGDPVVHVDEIGQAGVEHGRHAVGHDAPGVLLALGRPV